MTADLGSTPPEPLGSRVMTVQRIPGRLESGSTSRTESSRSRLQRALVVDVDGVDRRARRHEQPVPLLAAEAQVGARLRQVDLADQVPARRVAADPVLPRVGPPHAAPDVALRVDPHPVGKAGREVLGEDLVVRELVAVHVEDAHIRAPAVRDPAVDDVEPPLVGRERDPVRLVEAVGDHRRPPGARVEPVDVGRQLEFGLVALVVAEDAVARVGEPDRAVGGHHHVVRRVQPLALEAVDEDGDRAVGLGAGHPPRVVLAGDEPALAVARVAVRVVRRGAEDADVPVLLEPAHDAVVRDVAPQEVAAVAEVDGPLGPAEAGGDALDGGVADLEPEPLVDRLDARVRVAGAGEVPQGQLVGDRRPGRAQEVAPLHDYPLASLGGGRPPLVLCGPGAGAATGEYRLRSGGWQVLAAGPAGRSDERAVSWRPGAVPAGWAPPLWRRPWTDPPTARCSTTSRPSRTRGSRPRCSTRCPRSSSSCSAGRWRARTTSSRSRSGAANTWPSCAASCPTGTASRATTC